MYMHVAYIPVGCHGNDDDECGIEVSCELSCRVCHHHQQCMNKVQYKDISISQD